MPHGMSIEFRHMSFFTKPYQRWHSWCQVKPVAIAMDSWIPVPECSLPDRSATSCRIAGSSRLRQAGLNRLEAA